MRSNPASAQGPTVNGSPQSSHRPASGKPPPSRLVAQEVSREEAVALTRRLSSDGPVSSLWRTFDLVPQLESAASLLARSSTPEGAVAAARENFQRVFSSRHGETWGPLGDLILMTTHREPLTSANVESVLQETALKTGMILDLERDRPEVLGRLSPSARQLALLYAFREPVRSPADLRRARESLEAMTRPPCMGPFPSDRGQLIARIHALRSLLSPAVVTADVERNTLAVFQRNPLVADSHLETSLLHQLVAGSLGGLLDGFTAEAPLPASENRDIAPQLAARRRSAPVEIVTERTTERDSRGIYTYVSADSRTGAIFLNPDLLGPEQPLPMAILHEMLHSLSHMGRNFNGLGYFDYLLNGRTVRNGLPEGVTESLTQYFALRLLSRSGMSAPNIAYTRGVNDITRLVSEFPSLEPQLRVALLTGDFTGTRLVLGPAVFDRFFSISIPP